ncbi:MAG: hypothetical protein AMJ53_13970 [Gammaproteobacteria bacterium SG8_11]|nr:MAG: hypothetical protein AMJ53_13970 [Gammaproteobacteria bacterium SG8_11]
MELLPSRADRRASGSGVKAVAKWLSFFVLAMPGICAAGLLTEEQSLQLGLSQPHFVNVLESRVEAAQGALITTKTWSNPELELAREELGEETEINIWLRQRFDVSGRRSFNRDTAQADIDSIRAVNDSQRVQRGTFIRQRFFQALYYQQQQQLFSHWVEKFTTVEAAMRKREEAGDVSGYDRRRISREKVSLLARERHNQAKYQSAWQRLLGIIGAKQDHGYDGVQGDIAPDQLPPLESVLEAMAQQPVLVQLQHQAQSAHLAARSAERGKFPEFTLGLGHKRVDGPAQDESGLMVSASVAVPVFDRKQGAATLSELNAQARGLWHQAKQLAENARLFRQQSVNASFELVRIAETAYRNNEIGVLELLDAYRSALEAETIASQLALEARQTRIELDELFNGVSQ